MAIVHWPVELRHGQVGLRPLRASDGGEWAAARQRNASWLRPWDATQPPGAQDGARTFRAMARDWNRQARYGRMLPFVITYGGAAGGGGGGEGGHLRHVGRGRAPPRFARAGGPRVPGGPEG